MSTYEILLDDARGIYIPQVFVTQFDLEAWHVDPEAAAICAKGPDEEQYWDAWDEILRDAYFDAPLDSKTLKLGRWTLEQDGALFARHESHESETEDNA